MPKSTIVVTGGAGFIGSNIVARLAEDHAVNIVVCDRLRAENTGKWRNISKHPIADFISPENLADWLQLNTENVSAIIHMGAISSTTEPDADKIIHTNFGLSKNLFNWCADHGVAFIYGSSAATYGDGTLGFGDSNALEDLNQLRPLNAYGWSKWLFDLYAVRAAAKGQAPPLWAGLKFFNVYGPNEDHKGSMKSVIAQAWPKIKAGNTVSLFKSYKPEFEDGDQRRDFVYVGDIAEIVYWMIDNLSAPGLYNIGSGEARTFNELMNIAFSAAKTAPSIEYVSMPADIIQKYQYFTEANLTRLRSAGYKLPMTTLEDGINRYIVEYLSTDDPYR